ncbi:endolytic transglycosylase MltG [Aquibacillus halophilus]|nr:endolytic transglycosylase MltG [Aquibacillus halophilus]
MKQTIRAFSLGLLCSSLLLGATYYNTLKKPVESVKMTTEEMIISLESSGYLVLTEPPEITGDEDEEDQTQASDIDEPADDFESEDTVEKPTSENITHTLEIESGMGLESIIDKLASIQLIEDEEAFRTYLIENDYSTRIQVGEFKLNYGMSEKEIADTITNQ